MQLVINNGSTGMAFFAIAAFFVSALLCGTREVLAHSTRLLLGLQIFRQRFWLSLVVVIFDWLFYNLYTAVRPCAPSQVAMTYRRV
jgi:hypothetical protein